MPERKEEKKKKPYVLKLFRDFWHSVQNQIMLGMTDRLSCAFQRHLPRSFR